MEPVNVIGAGMTPFGVLDETLVQLAESAATEAMSESDTLGHRFDHLIVASQNPDEFVNKGHLSTLVTDHLGLVPAGATRVENHYKVIPDFDPESFGNLIPCGFIGEPLDMARAALFLASEDARYIVGQTLIIAGGTTSWMPFSDAFRKPNDNCFGKGYVPGI